MIQTSHINLLEIIQSDTQLKKAASTNNGEYAGPCPFCGGEDRFLVWPNQDTPRFWCRRCNRNGDVITYIRLRDNLGFAEACRQLQIETQTNTTRHKTTARSVKPSLKYLDREKPSLADNQWQQDAQWFTRICQEKLFSREGENARGYLHQRGLSDATLEKYGLGYCSSTHHQNWGKTQHIYLPEGIVIPWWIDRQIRTVKFRVSEGKPKYIATSGGAGGLYLSDLIHSGCVVVMTEGEFDALLLNEHIQIEGVVAVATGGNQNNQCMDSVVELAALSKQVLLAFDLDEAGTKATQWWQKELGDKSIPMQLTHHDITDIYLAGVDLNAWIRAAME